MTRASLPWMKEVVVQDLKLDCQVETVLMYHETRRDERWTGGLYLFASGAELLAFLSLVSPRGCGEGSWTKRMPLPQFLRDQRELFQCQIP